MDVSDNLPEYPQGNWRELSNQRCLGNATDLRRNSLLVFLHKSSDWDPGCAFRSQASQASQASSSVPRGDEKVWNHGPSDKMPVLLNTPVAKNQVVFQNKFLGNSWQLAEKKISHPKLAMLNWWKIFTIVNRSIPPWKLRKNVPLKTNDPMVGSQRRWGGWLGGFPMVASGQLRWIGQVEGHDGSGHLEVPSYNTTNNLSKPNKKNDEMKCAMRKLV